MSLLPVVEVFSEQPVEIATYPTKTYHMDLEEKRIWGLSDGIKSMEQVIYKALNTQRSTYLAYSANYGIELNDLFEMPMSFVMSELERRITDTLLWDTRIVAVDQFTFEVNGRNVHATFVVYTNFGNIEWESVVSV